LINEEPAPRFEALMTLARLKTGRQRVWSIAIYWRILHESGGDFHDYCHTECDPFFAANPAWPGDLLRSA
jgi:hypothetical protein